MSCYIYIYKDTNNNNVVGVAVNAFIPSGSLIAASYLTLICNVMTKNVEMLLPKLEKNR
jgi:hypothetical protein